LLQYISRQLATVEQRAAEVSQAHVMPNLCVMLFSAVPWMAQRPTGKVADTQPDNT